MVNPRPACNCLDFPACVFIGKDIKGGIWEYVMTDRSIDKVMRKDQTRPVLLLGGNTWIYDLNQTATEVEKDSEDFLEMEYFLSINPNDKFKNWVVSGKIEVLNTFFNYFFRKKVFKLIRKEINDTRIKMTDKR